MKLKGLKVLVTGGAGFIGSHIVDSLVEAGARVSIYDNFSFGSKTNLAQMKRQIKVVDGDILNFKRLKSAMKGIEVVSHHAAQLEICLSSNNPRHDLEVNTVGTLNVLKAAQESGVLKIINASSACVYGQTTSKTNESRLPLPNWAYGVSKLAAENYGQIYSAYHKLPVVSLRYAITYGEREWFRRVLTIFIKRAILGEPLVIFGKGDQVRDFIYVKDAVCLHNLCIENKVADGECYNVGTGIPVTISRLGHVVSKAAKELLGRDISVIREDTAEGKESKLVRGKIRNPAELQMMLLDPKKALQELGWQAKTPLDEGIRKEMLWACNNLCRWEKIKYTKI